jgi:hypothetical protein
VAMKYRMVGRRCVAAVVVIGAKAIRAMSSIRKPRALRRLDAAVMKLVTGQHRF